MRRYCGKLGSRAVWLSVSLAGRLPDDPREGAGWVVAVGGQVYELGSAAKGREEGGNPLALPLATPSVAAALALLTGVVGFSIGSAFYRPAELPQQTKIFIASPRSEPTLANAPKRSASSAPLTIAEQKERAELKVERDKAKLRMLSLKLQEDEQRLGELMRVEKDRGPDSAAVRMVFPPATGSQ
ncbi:MAG: hypothetical protein SGPRY_011286 [Prymnesium sp.]